MIMANVLNKPTSNFTQISNHILNDNNLSLKAKGLIAFMLSKPDKWKFSIEAIATQCKEGVSVVKAAVKELQQNKYLKICPVKNKKGVIQRWEYYLSHYPVNDFPHVDYPHVGFPHVDSPHVDNRPTSNTIRSNTEKKKERIPPSPREGIGGLVYQIKDARPEFAGMNDMAIENALKNAEAEGHDIQKNAQEFIADMANAVKPPDIPLSMLRKYLNHNQRRKEGTTHEQTNYK